MRAILDRLYLVSGVLAATALAAIAVLVLSQTIGRLFGVLVPSANELAGYCVAASAFLGLAPTLNHGVHIRVRIVTQHLSAPVQRWLEGWCLLLGLGLSGFATWYAIDLVVGSWRYGDVSPGLLAVPLWIPQLGMAAGLSIFTLSLLDNLLRLLRGREPLYREHESQEAGR
ncbi:MAG: TRAP transporter small permease [Halofilum sp. (in: g-proteobacteria)]|nr:TRAP transporter small permease [Halofilum sp. (in: g-proteobacteria)]